MYGDFSSDRREYVIDRVDTPRPWANYLCTRDGRYVALISHNAGGYSYADCPKDGRITRWRYNSLPEDRPGRYLYLRTPADGDFWTLSWQPVGKPRQHYRVSHGLGYSRFECDYRSIAATATYFVPLDDTLEIWQVELVNRSRKKVTLEIYPCAELCLGHALIDLINKPDDQHFTRQWFDRRDNALYATRTYWVTGMSANRQENKSWDKVMFMTASLPAAGYAGEREVFYGKYRDERNPLAIEQGELASRPVASGNLVAALQLRLELAPGERREFHVAMGVADKHEGPPVDKGVDSFRLSGWEKNCRPLLRRYRTVQAVDQALTAVRRYWTAYTDHIVVATPSANMNTFLNAWTQYQAKMTFVNSRNASYYQWGITRGMGFRDSLQDTIGAVIQEPDLVRERLLRLARCQRADGTCMHLFHPVSGEGEFTGHRDDPLWLITAVWYYLAETGDFDFLDAAAPFHGARTQATMLDHLLASVKFIADHLGPNGIPTFGRGDWNDTLDYVGGEDGSGESIWAGMFYAYNLRLLADILRTARRRPRVVRDLEQRHAAQGAALNRHAWDGQWYIRAVCADGKILGSKRCRAGRIYLNPQSWAVIAGVADAVRGRTAMDQVRRQLDCPVGPKLLAPAYHESDAGIGLITRCVWGKKENGAVFNHATTWAIMAECLLGRGDEALRYYEKLIPATFDQDTYQIEPYVYCQYTTSDEHETCGQGSHSWLSGTAAWMLRTTLDHLLGLRPTLAGMLVAPAVPAAWTEYQVVRKYRGTTYAVTVSNPPGAGAGIRQLQVDGQPHDPHRPLPVRPGRTIKIAVTMGHEKPQDN